MNNLAVVCLLFGLGLVPLTAYSDSSIENVNAIEQLIPANKLAKIRSSLPKVAYEGLRNIIHSNQTLWYDDEVMTPSYQDSVGAGSNETWPDLVAGSEKVIRGVYDRSQSRWKFPFAITAGTDHSTNLQIENFVYLPHENGQIVTIPIKKVIRNAGRYQWDWTYPIGTTFGEVLFINDGNDLLPTEIRTRKKYATGWAMNVFRPFPRAKILVKAVKKLRPDYMMSLGLSKLVAHLENVHTLQPKTLAGTEAFAPIFKQKGWIDSLPDFTDDNLVRELLRTTEFVAAYNTPWKRNGSEITYAATTTHNLSVVPNNYDAGILEVTDAACMRCHKETGRLVSEFYFDLYLYGELWGKDGIFSFHPFHEVLYPELRYTGSGPGGMKDNRKINPILARMNIFRMKATHTEEPAYANSLDETELPTHDQRVVTYREHIKPILDQNCTECHTGGVRKTDLSQFPFKHTDNLDQETIVYLILARAGGSSPSMPPGVRPKLTAQQIHQIKAWKDGGLNP